MRGSNLSLIWSLWSMAFCSFNDWMWESREVVGNSPTLFIERYPFRRNRCNARTQLLLWSGMACFYLAADKETWISAQHLWVHRLGWRTTYWWHHMEERPLYCLWMPREWGSGSQETGGGPWAPEFLLICRASPSTQENCILMCY